MRAITMIKPQRHSQRSLKRQEQAEPWTRWQGNKESPLAVVGHKYGTREQFKTYHGLPARDIVTNCRLTYYFQLIGIPIPVPPENCGQAAKTGYGKRNALLYFTNVKPYFPKSPGLEEILAVVTPWLILTLGNPAHKAICKLIWQPLVPPPLLDVVGKIRFAPRTPWGSGVYVVAMFHPSAPNWHRSFAEQVADWEAFGKFIRNDNRAARIRRWLRKQDLEFSDNPKSQ
jgi:hypothetical protein